MGLIYVMPSSSSSSLGPITELDFSGLFFLTFFSFLRSAFSGLLLLLLLLRLVRLLSSSYSSSWADIWQELAEVLKRDTIVVWIQLSPPPAPAHILAQEQTTCPGIWGIYNDATLPRSGGKILPHKELCWFSIYGLPGFAAVWLSSSSQFSLFVWVNLK